jgi:hypothetical protein
MGFGVDRLPIVRERKHAKVEGEIKENFFYTMGD